MTSLSSRKRAAKPKCKPASRKPAKPVAKAKRGITKQKLQWRDVLLEISYEPHYMGTKDSIAHLQIQVLSPKGAIIPITETGYRSQFLSTAYVEDAGGPAIYVREWLDSNSNSPAWKKKESDARQLSLF